MKECVVDFLDDCSARGLSSQTIATYRSNITYFLNFTSKDPKEIDMNDLRAFLGHLRVMEYKVGRQIRRGVAASTMNAYFSAMSSFYDFLSWEKEVQENIVPRFRKRYLKMKEQRNGENRRQLISISKMMELLELCLKEGDVLAWALIFFAAKTGLRKGEILAMDIHSLDFERSLFIVPSKAKRTNRLGFMDAELTHVMQQYLEWRESRVRADTKALWISPQGYRMGKNDPYELMTYYAQLLGIHDPDGPLSKKFTPHCCRHFFTTHLRRAGMSREMRMELRGDVLKDAMDGYDHIDPEELRKAYVKHVFKLLRIDTKQSTLVPFQ